MIVLGVPFFCTPYFSSLMNKDNADAVSSASVIIESPDGKFVILINEDLHQDKKVLSQWKNFFLGSEEIIFEDIKCFVAAGDSEGIKMAASLQSRLPQNQMKVSSLDPVLLVSKAEHKKYDVIVLSKQMYEISGAALALSAGGVTVCEN